MDLIKEAFCIRFRLEHSKENVRACIKSIFGICDFCRFRQPRYPKVGRSKLNKHRVSFLAEW